MTSEERAEKTRVQKRLMNVISETCKAKDSKDERRYRMLLRRIERISSTLRGYD
jgi:hypothetical protein